MTTTIATTTTTKRATPGPSGSPPIPTPASMRAGGAALVAGGLLFAVGNLVHPLQHDDDAYRGATWEAAHLVILASIPLLLLALPALHAAMRSRGAGRPSLAAAVLAVIGYVGMAGGMAAEAFVAPKLGHAGMEDLESGGFGVVTGMLGMCWVAALVPLFFALRRARLGPAVARWALVAVFVVLLGASSSTSEAAGASIIAATAAFGAIAAVLGWRVAADAETSPPAPGHPGATGRWAEALR
jgi:hypothetical protein